MDTYQLELFLQKHAPRTLGEELDMPEFQRELYKILGQDFSFEEDCEHDGYVDEQDYDRLEDALKDVYKVVTDYDTDVERIELAHSVYEIITDADVLIERRY